MKTYPTRLHTIALGASLAAGLATTAHAVPLVFNSPDFSSNSSTRSSWLSSLGISGGDYFIDFESGYSQGDHFTTLNLAGGLVVSDGPDATTPFGITITGHSADIGTSNPVGLLTAIHNNDFLRFDFSANPVDYFGFLDIDQSGFSRNIWTGLPLGSKITFADDSVYVIQDGDTDTTKSIGDSAEFWGLIGNDSGAIKFLDLATSGDATWGFDNIEFGHLPTITALDLPTDGQGGDGNTRSVPDETSTAFLLLGVAALGGVASRRRKKTTA